MFRGGLNRLLDVCFWLCVALVAYVVLQVFVVASFRIPSDSMQPALLPGDRIWVDKLSGGARLFDLPGAAAGEDVCIHRVPGWRKFRRGDVLVFNFPYREGRWDSIGLDVMKYYVKRCIAVPGDTLEIRGGWYRIRGVDGPLGNPSAQREIALLPDSGARGVVMETYPWDKRLGWTVKEFGPLAVPRRGQTVRMDRTACLLYGGPDPTIAMYNCAKRLEKDGCDAIIVPCNTAHAFVPYLERHLGIPFINMQQTALDEIARKLGETARIGLLATSGTVQTGIYSEKAQSMGLPMFVPDHAHQERVMASIYGPKGAKAGYTDGICKEDLLSAAKYLVEEYDCNCLILGCTELPLILDESDDFEIAGKRVMVIDPTASLARKVVKEAFGA